MTLAEAIKLIPSNQRLEIRVMSIELFTGSKGSLDHLIEDRSVDWINDTVISIKSSNPDTVIIELKDSVYTRNCICGRFLQSSKILSEYKKLYTYVNGDGPLVKFVKQLLAEIRQDGDIL